MQFPKQLRTPVAAAFLSALWPGLGQAAAGAPRRGTMVSIPMFGLVGSLLFLAIFERSSLLNLAVNDSWLTSLLWLDVVWVLYHVWAIVDAYRVARGLGGPPMRDERRRRSSVQKTPWAALAAVFLILFGTVGVHAQIAAVDLDWKHALYCLNAKIPCWVDTAAANATDNPDNGDGGDNVDPIDTATPATSGSGKPATPTPMVTYDPSSIRTFNPTIDAQKWNDDGELNVLLMGLGVQKGGTAAALGPDTIMVLHASTTTGASELISVGRNNTCTPLPTQEIAKNYGAASGCPAGTYSPMLFNLPNEILARCNKWPIPEFASTCGQSSDENRYLRAYKGFEMTVGNLLGMHIDGSMWINPLGLTTLIDALGGVTINVDTKMVDQPCGSDSSQATYQLGSQSVFAAIGRPKCPDNTHYGYFVPTGPSGIQKMKDQAAQSNGGLTVIQVPPSVDTKDRNGNPVHHDNKSDVAFIIRPGTYHFNGDWALAYARTRIFLQYGDFDRAAHQQTLLTSLRQGLDPCRFTNVANVLPLLGAVQAIPYGFNTDMDITNGDNLKAWANIAKNVLGNNVKQVVLKPATIGMTGYSWDPGSIAKAQQLIKTNFVKPAAPSPGASGSGGSKTCG